MLIKLQDGRTLKRIWTYGYANSTPEIGVDPSMLMIKKEGCKLTIGDEVVEIKRTRIVGLEEDPAA